LRCCLDFTKPFGASTYVWVALECPAPECVIDLFRLGVDSESEHFVCAFHAVSGGLHALNNGTELSHCAIEDGSLDWVKAIVFRQMNGLQVLSRQECCRLCG
jgi:hypothetical protein